MYLCSVRLTPCNLNKGILPSRIRTSSWRRRCREHSEFPEVDESVLDWHVERPEHVTSEQRGIPGSKEVCVEWLELFPSWPSLIEVVLDEKNLWTSLWFRAMVSSWSIWRSSLHAAPGINLLPVSPHISDVCLLSTSHLRSYAQLMCSIIYSDTVNVYIGAIAVSQFQFCAYISGVFYSWKIQKNNIVQTRHNIQ